MSNGIKITAPESITIKNCLFVPDDLAVCQRLLDEQWRRANAAEDKLDEQTKIVARIWEVLGNPSYDELKGRSIYEMVQCWIDQSIERGDRLQDALNEKESASRYAHEMNDERNAMADELRSAKSRLDGREKQLIDTQHQLITRNAELANARVLISQARDALNPAVSPLTRAKLDAFLAAGVETSSPIAPRERPPIEPDAEGDCKRCGLPFENPAEITHECPPGFTDSPRRSSGE